MIIPKSKVALETWLAELRPTTALSDLGAVLLSLQISELEHKCAELRKRMHHRAKPDINNPPKKRALRSAAESITRTCLRLSPGSSWIKFGSATRWEYGLTRMTHGSGKPIIFKICVHLRPPL